MDLSNYLVALVFIAGLLLGMPIAFVLLLSAFLGIVALRGTYVALVALTTMPFSRVSDVSIGLAVVPLFILMGYWAAVAGVSRNAYSMAYRWFGHIKGGLAIATVFACAAFAATSGSSVATSATVGKIAFTEMKRFDYDESITAGTIAAAGLLGIMIPPSIMFVVYGIITQADIGQLLIAGILPGILTAIVFSLGIYILAWRRPDLMPTAGERFSWRERFGSLREGWPIAILFTIIIGGIYSGAFTPTEAAAVGALCALLLAVLQRHRNWKEIFAGSLQAVGTTAMLFLILIGAGLLSQYIALSGLATDLSRFLAQLHVNRYVVLSFILLMYVPLGMFLEPISMCLITLPIVYPTIRQLGFDGVWFGVLMVKMSELANITPPLGVNVFVIRSINPSISLDRVFKGAAIFMALEVITLIILIIFPSIALVLPNLMR